MKSILQTDWNEVARVANFKTSKYARDTWTVVKNKLIGADASGGQSTPAPTTPAKGKAGKKGTSQKRKKRDGMCWFPASLLLWTLTSQ